MIEIQIAKKWLQAFNDHDLENLLALYNDHAVHFSPKLKIRRPETNGFIKGKEALHDWWRDAFDRIPQLAYHEKNIISNNGLVVIEYTRVVPGEENINVAEVLEVDNGLIIASRVYHG